MLTPAQVFISWSGERSRSVADALAAWLPLVLERPQVWLSSRDIPEGRRWVSELASILEQTQWGIFVITPENAVSPWILFEAGALSKNRETGRVIPYLVGLDHGNLPGPLAQFHAIQADGNGTWSMIRTMAALSGYEASEQVLRRRFDAFWPDLQRSLTMVAAARPTQARASAEAGHDDRLIDLQAQLSEVRELVRQLVATWRPATSAEAETITTDEALSALQGAWVLDDNTHVYARIINGDLLAPYCYRGDQDLTAYWYGWRRVDEYWFARFLWIHSEISGFAFLKEKSQDLLEGRWWYDHEFKETPQAPVEGSGVKHRWKREANRSFPGWAEDFLDRAQRGGVPHRLTSALQRPRFARR